MSPCGAPWIACFAVSDCRRTYGSAREYLDAGEIEGVGCIVLDVRLPGMSGLDFQAQRGCLLSQRCTAGVLWVA
jgi:FixJ family two-component response regulator